MVVELVEASKPPQDFSLQRNVSTGSTSAFCPQDSLVVEPVETTIIGFYLPAGVLRPAGGNLLAGNRFNVRVSLVGFSGG